MKLPSKISGKNLLISIIIIVSIFIIVVAIIQGGGNNSFSFVPRRFSGDINRLNLHCKQLSQKESVNWNYFYYYEDVKTKKSIVWCKVPKAASTTLTKMFLRLAGAKKSNDTRIHKLLRDFYPRLSPKIMKHRVKASKTFLVVRDPFERILSAFRDKLENYERDLEYRDGYYHDHYGKFMVQSGNATGNATQSRKEPTWQEFVQYLIKTSIGRYDEHWMPISRLCSPCSVGFNQIIKMDNFNTEIQKPLRHAGINVSHLGWSHKTGTVANKKIIASYFKNLTLTDVKKLYGKYKRDFQLFGYSPIKYFRLFKEYFPPENVKNKKAFKF